MVITAVVMSINDRLMVLNSDLMDDWLMLINSDNHFWSFVYHECWTFLRMVEIISDDN